MSEANPFSSLPSLFVKMSLRKRIGIFAERLLAQRSAKICRCLRAKPEFEFSFADFSVIGKSNIVAPLRCA